ncbi:MAG: hypothetical protein J6S23_04950 [Clostridia bacterium]|nr:hypothetical protein [Clostridia bacterium]
MNFKRILVLVMALVMIVSACAPAIHATADAVNHDHSAHEEAKKELNYVSLGDAMANGFGLDCYGDSKVTNGFLELSYESYPAKFAAWLAGLEDAGNYTHSSNTPQYYYHGEKANVTLMQLATQGVRVEDLLAMLQADPNALVENGLGSLGSTADLWISHKLDKNISDKLWVAYVASTYQSAVRDADVITLGVGNANFDGFLLDRLMSNDDEPEYSYMTLDAALELVKLDAEKTALVKEVYNKFNAELIERELPAERVNVICDRVAYTVASYAVSYAELLDLIVEINPDVELVIVPMLNNVTDFEFDVVYNGGTIELNVYDLLSVVYDALNAYVAGVPTTKQLQGEYEEAKFYYAELPTDDNGNTIKVEMLDGGKVLFGEIKFGTPSANGHKTLAEAVINAYNDGHTVLDETIENIKESALIIAGLVAQYYDEAYIYGYKYADTHGYTDKVVTLIDRVINQINRVDLSDNTMTDEFRADLEVELDAIVKTLEELKEAINTDKAKDVPGLLATLRDLSDDVLTHVGNIYALCEQAGIDVNQLVILPAIYEALEIIENELIPALVEWVETVVEKISEHIQEKLDYLHGELVAFVVYVQLLVGEQVDMLLELYGEVVAKLYEVYGEFEYALGVANDILVEIADMAKAIFEGAENALELAEDIYNTVYNFLVENGDDIVHAAKVAAHVYSVIVKFIVENQEEIEDALEIAGKAFKFMLKVGAYVYANYDEVVEFATNVYTTIVNFLVENEEEIEEALRIAGLAFDFIIEAAQFVYENKEEIYELATKVYAEILRTIDRVHGLINSALDLYDYVVDVLVEAFGNVENALVVAEKIYNRVVKLLVQYKNDLDMLVAEAYALYEEILAIIVETYNETQNAVETAVLTAKMLHKRLIQTVCAMNVAFEKAMYEASNGSYELKDDSAYVALGNSGYGEELAAMLNLSEKFLQFTADEDYSEAVAGADLVTLKVNNGEFYGFAYTQIMGILADIVRSNDDLVGWYNNPWIGDKVRAEIESYGIDLDAETIELEWSKYLVQEDVEILDALLARLKAEIVRFGLPETVEIDITSAIEEILVAEGLLLPGVAVNVEPIVINVADLAVYAVENLLYSYVQFIERTAILLENVRELSPNATVVITHVANPLDLMPFDISAFIPNFDECAMVLDTAVSALNGYLYGLAFVNENTIFVDSEDAQDIYDALHVFCDHVYDDPCLDVDCNRCGAERVAPGHSFTHYVNNGDQTCTKDGTATAKCDRCSSTDTVTVKGSATGHNWQDATCITAKKCSNCGEVSGKALGHKYDNSCDTDCNRCGVVRSISHKFGDWEVTKKPTLFKDGEQMRTCSVCGYTETMPYVPESQIDIVELAALAVGSIIVAFGASTAIILLIQKKKEK